MTEDAKSCANYEPLRLSYEEVMQCDAVRAQLGEYMIPVGFSVDGLLLHSLSEIGSLLISGGTGGGKSDFVHGAILSLMQQHTPEEFRLLGVDAKRIELTLYDHNPYLLTEEAVLDSGPSFATCQWLWDEVERRTKTTEHKPKILFVLEEAADLLFSYPEESSRLIANIASKGPGVGVSTILLSSRPQVEVFTDEIRNAFRARMAFWMRDQPKHSEFFLGTKGAEDLQPKGEALFRLSSDTESIFLQTLSLSTAYRNKRIKESASLHETQYTISI